MNESPSKSSLVWLVLSFMSTVFLLFLVLSGPSDQKAQNHPASPGAMSQPGGLPTFPAVKQTPSQNIGGQAETWSETQKEIHALEQQLAKSPGHLPIVLQLGNLYYDSHNDRKAIEYYTQYLEKDSTNVNVRVDRATCYFRSGDAATAIKELTLAYQIEPNHENLLYNLGAIHANQGHKEAAKRWWNELIEKYPDSSLANQARHNIEKL